MTCPPLLYTVSHTRSGRNFFLNIETPEVYPCTNIQLRLRTAIIVEDWFDYATLTGTTTEINFPVSDYICYIDVRLSQCCVEDDDDPSGGGGGGGGSGPPSDEPPCTLIASLDSECSSSSIAITNPFRRSSDNDIETPYNSLHIPKQVKLKLTQESCDDVQAQLCTVRCADDIAGICPCKFSPVIDILSLPTINPSGITLPYGAPIDFDKLCNSSNYRGKPSFPDAKYTKVEAYYQPKWYATPFIDNIGYSVSNINVNTWVKVHTSNTADEMRQWLQDHFKFLTINKTTNTIKSRWPYTDLYWTPYDFCVANQGFVVESGTIYLDLIPC